MDDNKSDIDLDLNCLRDLVSKIWEGSEFQSLMYLLKNENLK